MKKDKAPKVPKKDTITIRLDSEMESYIEQVADACSKKMHMEISKTWVVRELMRLGLPHFEKEYNISRKSQKTA